MMFTPGEAYNLQSIITPLEVLVNHRMSLHTFGLPMFPSARILVGRKGIIFERLSKSIAPPLSIGLVFLLLGCLVGELRLPFERLRGLDMVGIRTKSTGIASSQSSPIEQTNPDIGFNMVIDHW